jgi:hypothetical protein
MAALISDLIICAMVFIIVWDFLRRIEILEKNIKDLRRRLK